MGDFAPAKILSRYEVVLLISSANSLGRGSQAPRQTITVQVLHFPTAALTHFRRAASRVGNSAMDTASDMVVRRLRSLGYNHVSLARAFEHRVEQLGAAFFEVACGVLKHRLPVGAEEQMRA
jgi:hypothetical protein